MQQRSGLATASPVDRAPFTDNIGLAVRRLAERSPGAVVLYGAGGAPHTYSDLFAQQQKIQKYLNGIGVGRMDRVVSVVSNNPVAVTCFYSVAASSIYTPLPPDLMDRNYRDFFCRLKPKILIVEQGLDSQARDEAEKLSIPILDLLAVPNGKIGAFTLDGGAANQCESPGFGEADDTAVILPTSGTTDRPKLVRIRQAQLLYDSLLKKNSLGLGGQDRELVSVPPYFGSAIKAAMIPTILAGSALIWGSPFEPGRFFDLFREFKPSWFGGGATIMKAIVEHLDRYNPKIDTGGIRFIRSTVASLDEATIRRLETVFGAPVIECYSSTEAGGISSNPLPPAIQKPNSVGIPLHDNVAIFDSLGQAVPTGDGGEIVVRGPSVFDGYFDDPDSNASAFYGEWFRTGDLGRFDDDGYLYVTGRLKEMISRGGMKISPLEIDKTLEQHPLIDQAVTFAIPHPTMGEDVAAAINLCPDATVSAEDIRDFCRPRMVAHKIPRMIVFLENFPRDANGKILRGELTRKYVDSHPKIGNPKTDKSMREMWSGTESAVAGLWSGVLEIEISNLDDDFFVSGGDAQRAATLLAQINQVFGVNLPIKVLFEGATTVRKIARLIEQTRDGIAP